MRDGDGIELEVAERRLHLDVPAAELARRRAAWAPPAPAMAPSRQRLYVDHGLEADKRAALDLLVGCRGHAVPHESH